MNTKGTIFTTTKLLVSACDYNRAKSPLSAGSPSRRGVGCPLTRRSSMLRYECGTSELLAPTFAWAQAAGGARVRDEAFLARARRVFARYDDGSGHLGRQEAKLAWLALLGCKPSRCELADLLEPEPAAPRIGDGEERAGAAAGAAGSVGWARFAEAAARRRAGIDGSDEVRQAFKAFDRRCAGFLTLAHVKAVFREVAPHVSERTGACPLRRPRAAREACAGLPLGSLPPYCPLLTASCATRPRTVPPPPRSGSGLLRV